MKSKKPIIQKKHIFGEEIEYVNGILSDHSRLLMLEMIKDREDELSLRGMEYFAKDKVSADMSDARLKSQIETIKDNLMADENERKKRADRYERS